MAVAVYIPINSVVGFSFLSLWVHFACTFCVFWTQIFVSFPRLKIFSFIISSNMLSPFSLSFHLLTPSHVNVVHLIWSQRSLKLFSCLKILFAILIG